MQCDSVATARGSAKGADWSEEEIGPDVDESKDEVEDPPLGPAEARLYRGIAARLNYIAPDRPDIGFAVKESARAMSSPRVALGNAEAAGPLPEGSSSTGAPPAVAGADVDDRRLH